MVVNVRSMYTCIWPHPHRVCEWVKIYFGFHNLKFLQVINSTYMTSCNYWMWHQAFKTIQYVGNQDVACLQEPYCQSTPGVT